MIIGLPAERRAQEHRVVLTPSAVGQLVRDGHRVLVEPGAGIGSGLPDEAYRQAGAALADEDTVWGAAELVIKVKEPQPQEYRHFRPGLTLFCYLHLAALPELAAALGKGRVTAVAFETVTAADGSLPILRPMSQIAGRLASQAGAAALQRPAGGRGVLLAGAPGVPSGRVVVIGAGVAGTAAVEIAIGLGAKVTLVDIDPDRLERAQERFGSRIQTQSGSPAQTAAACADADVVVGAVLVPGGRAPVVLDTETINEMRPGSVLVDIAIDQGGCFAGSRPTSHETPTVTIGPALLYAVPNIPGAVPYTASRALSSRVLPYVRTLAASGWQEATRQDPHLAAGLTTESGRIVHPLVAEAVGAACAPEGEQVTAP